MTTGLRVAALERASMWEWIQAALLATNLVWTTLCLGGYRPETTLVTLLLTGATVVVHCLARVVPNGMTCPIAPSEWFAVPFLVYAGINVVVVSPVRWLGWLDWLGWANMAAVFWVMRNGLSSRRPRQLVFLTLVVLGIVAVILACYQRFIQPDWLMLGRTQVEQFLDRSSGSFGIPNSLAGFLILLLPVSGALAFRAGALAVERVWWSWVTAVFGFGLLFTVSRGGWIALAIGLVVWPLRTRQRWKKRALRAAVVLGAIVVTGAVVLETVPAVRERFARLLHDSGELSRPILWRAAGKIFRDHPLVGSGAGSYNTVFEQHRPERFVDAPQWAHNDYLNTLSDYGGIGLALLVGGVAGLIWKSRRDDAAPATNSYWMEDVVVRAGLAIGALAFALQAFVDFHLKIPALAMAVAVIGALALPRKVGWSVQISPPRSVRQRLGWLVAAAAATMFMIPMSELCRAEALRYGARQKIDGVASRSSAEILAAANLAEGEFRRAVQLAPSHGGAWSDLAYAFELRAFAHPAQTAELAAPAIEAAKRATQLSTEVPEFWIRLGVALDMQPRRPDAALAFEKAVKLAPRNSQAWYYYAHHLSFATDGRDSALRAIATCLSLDPGNRAAEALQAKLIESSRGALSIP